MIWNSVIGMTILDLIIVGAIALVSVAAARAQLLSFGMGSKLGSLLIVFGLSATALFYVADLIVMHVLPAFIGQAEAMTAMTYLHLNLQWFATVVSVALLCIGFSLAIVDRKRIERAARESEARYRTIVRDQTDFIVRWQPGGTRTWVNDKYCDFFGKTREELIGTSFFPLITDGERARIQRDFKALTPDAPARTGVHRVVSPNGDTGWVEWTDRAVFDKTGDIIEIQSVGRDITARKQAELALRESETKYRNLVENTQDWVWQIDLTGRHVYSNRQLQKVLGYSMKELEELRLEELIHPDDIGEVRDRLPTLIANKRGWEGWVLRFLHKNGTYRYMESSAIPVLDSLGVISGFRGIDRDITFRSLLAESSTKLLENSVGRAVLEETLGRFAAHFDVDRMDCWWLDENGESVALTCQWVRDGLVAGPATRRLNEWPYFARRVSEGQVVRVPDVAKLPVEAAAERANLERSGETAKLLVPLTIGSEIDVVGCGCVALVGRTRDWTDEEVRNLQLTFNTIATADLRIRIQADLRHRERDLARSERIARVGNYSLFPDEAVEKVFPLTGKAVFSEELVSMYGVRPGEDSFDVLTSRLHEDDRERVLSTLRDVLETESGFVLHYRIRRPDGKLVYVEDRGEIDHDTGGLVRIFGSVKDITETVLRERKLEHALSEIQELKDRLEEENVHLRDEVRVAHGFSRIIGDSPALRRCLDQVSKVAPTDTSVLILGETGTGKELLAQTIHDLSPRKDERMISVNCAALPAELVESELFGHEAGAFTGAGSRRPGRFELADGGTLFLDEIGEFPLELQGKLLRVVQDGTFERLGGTETLRVDVRLVAATNRQLKDAVDRGEFRADLYYRLNTYPIEIPPLGQRTEDIPLLAEHFVRKHSDRLGRSVQAISSRMLRYLQERSWPGNVRELESFIERALISASGSVLTMGSLDEREPTRLRAGAHSGDTTNLQTVERDHILQVLERCGWRIGGERGAAAVLGLPPSTLRSKMKRLGIERAS